MKSMSPKDRRRHKRVPLLIPISLRNLAESEMITARVMNISAGGAFVKVFHAYQLGEELKAQIDFTRTKLLVEKIEVPPDLIRLLGTLQDQRVAVRWIEEGSTGAGLEFLDLEAKYFEPLNQLVEFVADQLPSDWDLP